MKLIGVFAAIVIFIYLFKAMVSLDILFICLSILAAGFLAGGEK